MKLEAPVHGSVWSDASSDNKLQINFAWPNCP